METLRELLCIIKHMFIQSFSVSGVARSVSQSFSVLGFNMLVSEKRRLYVVEISWRWGFLLVHRHSNCVKLLARFPEWFWELRKWRIWRYVH